MRGQGGGGGGAGKPDPRQGQRRVLVFKPRQGSVGGDGVKLGVGGEDGEVKTRPTLPRCLPRLLQCLPHDTCSNLSCCGVVIFVF